MEPHRLRLKFDDSVLTDSQKLEGLKRSWVLVDPEHETISDFVSHLLHSFNLWNSCPHGIFLSMEGYAVPYFESIEILKGNDLVCVKRMGSKLLDGMKESWEEGIVEGKGKEKLPLTPNEEFEMETGGYLSEAEVDDEDNVLNEVAPIKKRKKSKQLNSSKKKRKRKSDESSSSGKEDAACYLQNGCSQKKSQNSKQDQVHNGVCTNVDNWNEIVTLSSEPDGTRRLSVSRSTKRKKAQRLRQQTLRIAAQEQHLKMQAQGQGVDDENHTVESERDSETDNETVPVVVRPGHIRFTAPGKEKDVQQYQEAEGSFNWQGIMNKKGRKKGKEKQTPFKRNEDKRPCRKQPATKCNEWRSTEDKQPAFKWNEQSANNTWGGNRSNGVRQSGPKWNGYRANGRNWATQKAPQANPSKEFEKLVPMVDFPVQGDIIAYRILEISSSLVPELTAYRVGKVSCSDPEANTVKLVPVPEYPFEFKKASNCISDELDDASRYKEDGSLEIDFPSLADVRIVKCKSMDTSTSFHQMACATPTSGWTVTNAWASPSTPVSGWGSTLTSGWRTETPGSINWTGTNTAVASTSGPSENGTKDVWEEMSAAMNAKREERLKEDNWNKKPKPVNYSWSQKTFRGRAQNRRGSN